jgi:hypothetical protein
LGGFDAVFVRWSNTLGTPVHVIVDYEFTLDGANRKLTTVFSASDTSYYSYINDLAVSVESKIKVTTRVKDDQDNYTEYRVFDDLHVMKDEEVPRATADKKLWMLPAACSTPLEDEGNTINQTGDAYEGRLESVIDGYIDGPGLIGEMQYNYMMASTDAKDPYQSACGEKKWSLIIDLGDYYELSRIITYQRYDGANSHDANGVLIAGMRGAYYGGEGSNVQKYRMFGWNDVNHDWDTISDHSIPVPKGNISDIEWYKLGKAGDMAYMLPKAPGFTKPYRWFRYQQLGSFQGPNTYSNSTDGNLLSEIRLFCREVPAKYK